MRQCDNCANKQIAELCREQGNQSRGSEKAFATHFARTFYDPEERG